MKRTKYFSLFIAILTLFSLCVLLFADEKEYGVYEKYGYARFHSRRIK